MEQLLQILRDPIWQFVGAALGAIALGVSVLALLLQHQEKALSLQILERAALSPAPAAIGARLRGIPADRASSRVSAVRFRLRNTGQLPITPSDYIEPIRIGLAPQADIIATEALASRPPDLNMTMQPVNRCTVEFTRSLLNPGEYITGRIIAADNDDTFRPTARIVGITTITVRTSAFRLPTSPQFRYGLTALLLTGLAFILQGILFRIDLMVGWLLAVNEVAFGLFVFDKLNAFRRRSRVPEIVLLLLAAAGGSVGVLAAMYLLRHKTARTIFRVVAPLALVIQAALLIAFLATR